MIDFRNKLIIFSSDEPLAVFAFFYFFIIYSVSHPYLIIQLIHAIDLQNIYIQIESFEKIMLYIQQL